MRNGGSLDEFENGSTAGWMPDWASPSSCPGCEKGVRSSTEDVGMASSRAWNAEKDLGSLETVSGEIIADGSLFRWPSDVESG